MRMHAGPCLMMASAQKYRSKARSCTRSGMVLHDVPLGEAHLHINIGDCHCKSVGTLHPLEQMHRLPRLP